MAMLAIVCDRWDLEGGGVEHYLADLTSYASMGGIKTRVYAAQILGQQPSERIREISHVRWPSILSDRQYCKKVGIEIAVMAEPTVLALRPFSRATHYQLHSGLYAAAFEGERDSLPSAIRRLLYPAANRLNLKRQRLLRLQERLLDTPETPCIMAFSHFTALDLQRRYHIPLEEITILPHGVNLDRFRPGSAKRPGTTIAGSNSGREPALLFVAHNFFLKGLHCLLEALGRIRESGVEIPLRVVGSGPRAYFEKLARRHGIASQVKFLGSILQDDLAHLYRKSAALVHPTFYDPCSLATLESLASGCPVVTTRRNGAAELFESGREGFILNDPRDTDALANALLTLRDPSIAEQMSQAASDLAPRLDIRRHMMEAMKWLGI